VQYIVRANLGWKSLRPVQGETIPAILDGATTVVVAPTAGGKTEAAVLPLISRVLEQGLAPTSILYVAPLRALLNDLGLRIGAITGHLGLTTAVWHGDVRQRERNRIASSPPDILLTTPESLEVLLSLTSEVRRGLLETVRAVVVDEVHLFYGSDRGTHALALIERLQSWTRHDLQRIALSATLGNPEDLARWFRGSSDRPVVLARIRATEERAELFDVRYRGSKTDVARELETFAAEKVLAFCRTRADVEEIAAAIATRGLPAWPHHSALSRDSREASERAFRDARRGVLVATSTLELGIDIGDLDRVVQVDAPATVAAMLQRLGRSVRRPGNPARMTFIPTNADQLVLACGILALHARSWVEPLEPSWQPFPILAQQALATLLQTGGLARSELVGRLSTNAAFSRISAEDIEQLVDALINNDVLAITDGTLTFGHAGERQFGYRAFSELASVFNTPESVNVTSGSSDVGTLDRWFVDEMQDRDRSTFLLGGRAWKVISWPEAGALMEVSPAEHAEAPLYTGGGTVLGFEVMQAVRSILAASDVNLIEFPQETSIGDRAVAALARAHELASRQSLDRPGTCLVRDGTAFRWYTYAGLRANRAIVDILATRPARIVTCTNTAIRIADDAFSFESFIEEIKALSSPVALQDALSQRPAPKVGAEVKFVKLLPAGQFKAFARERIYDIEGAAQIVGLPIYLAG
jgi:ATP-dependent helicase Lhr and Lhr-like helicase